MNGFVLDCSIAVCWCIADQATLQTDALLHRAGRGSVFVPALWHVELSNVLLQAERRGQLTAGLVTARLDLMAALPIQTDDEVFAHAWHETVALARAEKLTTYDATYLELALRRHLPLATRDSALSEAARRNGVKTLPA